MGYKCIKFRNNIFVVEYNVMTYFITKNVVDN